MIIYIASSWKNQHAVEMLTLLLRDCGHQVESFVDNRGDESHGLETDQKFDFEKWVHTPGAQKNFEYDTKWATHADVVIYIGPSGPDAWAEVGAAWGSGGPYIIGMHAKGEGIGLMRKMIPFWYSSYRMVLEHVNMLTPKVRAA